MIPCTPKEVEILHMLTSNVGQVFSREQILARVWGYDYFGDTRTVDAHIKRIRAEAAPGKRALGAEDRLRRGLPLRGKRLICIQRAC